MSAATPYGIISQLRAKPGDKTGVTVPRGRWCLHTTSTVPFVSIKSDTSTRIVTWGEAFEVGSQGQFMNASAHEGDIHLAPVFDGVVALRPAQYSIPVKWDTIPGGDLPPFLQTQWLDVRGARRAFLVLNTATPPVPITIQHANKPDNGAPSIGRTVGDNTTAAGATGIVTEVRAVVLNQYSLGLRARDVAPGDPYPHALLERVRVQYSGQDVQTLPTIDAFFHVEF